MACVAQQKHLLPRLVQRGRLIHGGACPVANFPRTLDVTSRLSAATSTSTQNSRFTSATVLQRPPRQTLVTAAADRWLSPQRITPHLLSTCHFHCAPPCSRTFSTSTTHLLRKTGQLSEEKKGDDDKEEKVSIFKRFKQMYKDYWYVLVPVHLVTSSVWFGAFYYASKSGLDIAGLLQSWGFSDAITEKLRNSAAGHVAVAYALYKLATPARYTVTLGGTTYTIKVLSERGYIKPVPSRKQLQNMYEDRREEFMERMEEMRKKRRTWRENFQERRKRMMRSYGNYRRKNN